MHLLLLFGALCPAADRGHGRVPTLPGSPWRLSGTDGRTVSEGHPVCGSRWGHRFRRARRVQNTRPRAGSPILAVVVSSTPGLRNPGGTQIPFCIGQPGLGHARESGSVGKRVDTPGLHPDQLAVPPVVRADLSGGVCFLGGAVAGFDRRKRHSSGRRFFLCR